MNIPTQIDFYAAPDGKSGATGTASSPFNLQFAFDHPDVIKSGKVLGLKGGIYKGKFNSRLNGVTVRSLPNEWAKLDGYVTTTLVNPIDATQQNITLASSNIFDLGNDEIAVGGEIIKVFSRNGNVITSCLRGASNSSNGAEPHTAGIEVVATGDNLRISGDDSLYTNIEILNSRPSRDGLASNQGLGRGDGIKVLGKRNKVINNVIHDTLDGLMSGSSSADTEIYGNIIFNNGMHVGDTPYGHGMYLENSGGVSKIRDNIVINNFNLGAQAYGVTAPYVGGEWEGNIIANSGAPMGLFNPTRRNYNLIYGTESQQSPTASVQNNYFYHPNYPNSYQVIFGYGAGANTGTFKGNYIVGGENLFIKGTKTNLNFTDNKLYSSNGFQYTVASPASATWDKNIYYKTSGKDVFGISGVGLFNFQNWKTRTGYDATSTETNSAMPETVIVRPNIYEAGRGHVIIYAEGSTAVKVDISSLGLTNGQNYTVKNAFDYLGESVISGVYDSSKSTIVIPMENTKKVAAPIGYNFTPLTTSPNFTVLVVVSEKAAPADTPYNTVQQYTLTGKITRKNGKTTISGAQVTLTDDYGHVYTTVSKTGGVYEVPNLIEIRKYTMVVTKPDTTYAFSNQTVSLTKDFQLNISATNI
jgi:hypothetical protein